MADEAQIPPTSNSWNEPGSSVIRSVRWREVFPFLHLFRSFRIAVHPSKLALGLMALLCLYIGGRVLDGLWPQGFKANYNEANDYAAFVAEGSGRSGAFQARIDQRRLENQKAWLILEGSDNPDDTRAAAVDFHDAGLMRGEIVDRRNAALAAADARLDKDVKEAGTKDLLKRDARERHAQAVTGAMVRARDEEQGLRVLEPRGLFDEFFGFETTQIDAVVRGVLANDWTRGSAEAAGVNADLDAAARHAGLTGLGRDAQTSGVPQVAGAGVVPAIANFFITGPGWLIRYHYVYFILYFALFLLVWAVFGGAIARIAAVHAARDEKISVRQALRFSVNKVLSFVFAPVIPLGIVLFIGLVMAVGGLLYYIPWAGPILAGALLFLALIGGVLIALVLIGTLGGVNLMYPTVAAEGSDSFDAISRSFSYVYARPWRMLFYTAVAIAYGAITYVFVKLFIFLVLAVTHYFVGWWLAAAPGRWFPEMWPTPTWTTLPYDVNFTGLKFTEKVGAFLICFWNYLLIGLLGAFAISFYFSSNTIIYFLMRREVDATDLDDVYLEESDDELADSMGAFDAAAPTPQAPIAETPAPVAEATVVVVAASAELAPAAAVAPSAPAPVLSPPATINLSEGSAPAHEAPRPASVVVNLSPADASLSGSRIGLEQSASGANIGFWESGNDTATWRPSLPLAGTWRVIARCAAVGHSSDFIVEVAGQRLTGRAPSTASWSDYADVEVGQFDVSQPGSQELRIRPADPAAWLPMNLAGLRLTRVGG